MAKRSVKIANKLARRQATYPAANANSKLKYHKPGSQNWHKS